MIDIIFILVRYLCLQDIYIWIKLKVDYINDINRTGSNNLIF